jgi:hypothetical protein
MEGLTRLVSESLVRHGLDRPVDYRRLRWSRWFRCESHHSLLLVPSKPGVFALAEEVASFDLGKGHVGTAALGPGSPARGRVARDGVVGCSVERSSACVEERRFSAAPSASDPYQGMAPAAGSRRMLAVTQFFEDDDMAFVLDRMMTRENPMRSRLASGRYFVRFVIVEDRFQRRSVHSALTQWLNDSAEKASGIGSHFAASLELTPATEYVNHGVLFDDRSAARVSSSAGEGTLTKSGEAVPKMALDAPTPHHSGAAADIRCPSALPSGF